MTSEILLENLSLGLQQAADGLSGAMWCSPAQDSSDKTNTLCGIIGKETQATILTQVFSVDQSLLKALSWSSLYSHPGVLGKTSPPKHSLSAKGPSKTAEGKISATIPGMMNRGKRRDTAYSKFWRLLDYSTNRRDFYSILKKELRSPGLS